MRIDSIRTVKAPPLKWAGGKRWLVPYVSELWCKQKYNRLVEPFVGGMAIALGIQPKKALLNDINPHLINFYRWLQKGLSIELELKNEAGCYYQYREEFNSLIKSGDTNSKKAAELFYFLNKQGYNGLCRFSKNGFNVPFGKYKKVNCLQDLSNYTQPIQDWNFICMDFSEIKIQKRDFIYADPPYDVEFTKYSKEDFRWNDQVRLANWLASCSATVVTSNQATDRIVDLYKSLGFKIRFLDAPRRIACNGDRASAREIFAYRTHWG